MNTKLRGHADSRFLLRCARIVFTDPGLTSVVEPAIADFQRELSDAAVGRAWVRVRGYAALGKVFFLAALVPGTGAGAPLLHLSVGLNGGFLVVVLVPLLYASLWPTFGLFTASAPIAGLLFAFAVRAWNTRHPAVVAESTRTKDPVINLASIPVGGDAGGFLFMVASVLTMLGLPQLRGFVAGTAFGGVALAYALFVWHRRHADLTDRRILRLTV